MVKVQRENVCSHITALSFMRNYLIVGECNRILLFDWGKKSLIEDETVFQNSSVHGIKFNNSQTKVLIFGAKSYKIYSFNPILPKRFRVWTEETQLIDWIHDAKWIVGSNESDYIGFILAHNWFILWNLEKQVIAKKVHCEENCIIYTANIISLIPSALMIAVGTVFKEILLWSPNYPDEKGEKKDALHRLIGHQGVIFSVDFNANHELLCTTSDDRTLRLWKIACDFPVCPFSMEYWQKANIQISHVLYAHESRVWSSVILSNFIVSIGEDSYICFWSLGGSLLKKEKCHKGGSIWCIESTSSLDGSSGNDSILIATGGSDGGIFLWKMCDNFSVKSLSQISVATNDDAEDMPRTVSLVTVGQKVFIITITDKGFLLLYDTKLRQWNQVYYNPAFASYCVLAVSQQSKFIALGNVKGELVLMHNPKPNVQDFNHGKFRIYSNKICALHWLENSSEFLLTCGLNGHLVFWHVSSENNVFDIQRLKEFYLPKCKRHWWSSAALLLKSEDCIIVGDRGGSINVYCHVMEQSSNEKANPDVKHKFVHGESGVTDVQEHNSLIYSSGRDGRVNVYHASSNSLCLLHSIKVSHNLEWIGRILFHGENLLLLGFRTTQFVVWSVELERSVMTTDCGGGHRSWHFLINENHEAVFTAIKQREILHTQEDLSFVLNESVLRAGISGEEFCSLCYLFTSTDLKFGKISVCACGGEDNTLRIIGFTRHQNPSRIISVYNLSGHLSSIRAIAKSNMVEDNTYLVVSVGGRAQMIVWRIRNYDRMICEEMTSYMLSTNSLPSKPWKSDVHFIDDPQIRYMDVAVSMLNDSSDEREDYMIITACSDSYTRLYLFIATSKQLIFQSAIQHSDNCILKVSLMDQSSEQMKNMFVTGATDGYLKVFSYQNFKSFPTAPVLKNVLSNYPSECAIPLLSIQVHQSGVNSLDVKKVSECLWLLCSGGDDNAFSFVLIKLDQDITEKMQCDVVATKTIQQAHASQITGVKIFGNDSVVTTSIDQKLNIWKWTFVDDCLNVDLRFTRISSIPDIACLEMWENEDPNSWIAVVCGEGIESFSLVQA